MDRWEERKLHFETFRLEYSSLARALGIVLAARAALLITSATLIGTITNMYFSGLSTFKLAKIDATGDVISTLGNTPRFVLTVFIAMLIGLVVTAVYSFDDALGEIQNILITRGSFLERTLSTEEGLFHQFRILEPLIAEGFGIARIVLFVIAFGWATFFVFIGAL